MQQIFNDQALQHINENKTANNYYNFLPENKSHFANHYEQDAVLFDYNDDIHPSWKNEALRLHQSILENISYENKNILDCGCGNAWLAQKIAKTANVVVSLDISTTNPQKAVAKVPSANHFGISAETHNLPFLAQSFDYIVACEVMEHVPHPTLFVRNLIKYLKPEGKLIITTPYNEKITCSTCIHCNKLTPHSAHLHSFNEQNIQKIVENETYKIAKTQIFSNKILLILRTDIITKYLPFWAWKFIDKYCNLLLKKATRMLIIIKK